MFNKFQLINLQKTLSNTEANNKFRDSHRQRSFVTKEKTGTETKQLKSY